MKTTVFVAAFAAAFAAAAVPLSAGAQSFPSKPIRFVVGFPPGGATDNVARAIAPKMGEFLGQPVVVENNGGAAGLAASIQVARSAPDGHTILLATTGGHLLRPLLQQQLPVDSFRDFTPITQLIESVFAIAANPATGPKSLEDLIDRARKNPGKLSYGTAGLGTETHLLMERIGQLINGPMQVVPYKGGGPAVNDLLGGQIPLVTQPVVTFLGHHRAGKVNILTVMLPKRWEMLPDVPAIVEAIPGFEKPSGGAGVWGPAQLPTELANRLHQSIAFALKDPKVSDGLKAQGQIPLGSTPQQFDQDLRKGQVIFAELVKQSGLKAQ
jgi:tripartite-type tricarboxylate transporter receptor subunit TctC